MKHLSPIIPTKIIAIALICIVGTTCLYLGYLAGKAQPKDFQLSVVYFGAIPNDTIDDSDAISLAIAFCQKHPELFNVSYFPKGTYNVNKTIKLLPPAIRMVGEDGSTIQSSDSIVFDARDNWSLSMRNMTLTSSLIYIINKCDPDLDKRVEMIQVMHPSKHHRDTLYLHWTREWIDKKITKAQYDSLSVVFKDKYLPHPPSPY